ARSAKNGPILCVTQRANTHGIPEDDHISHGIQEYEVVRTIELAGEPTEQLNHVRPLIASHFMGDVMQNDFGIVIAREVVVVVGQELFPEFGKVGKLTVECKGEPFPLAAMAPFERLGVASRTGTTSCVACVADRSPAGEFLHDGSVFTTVVDT